MAHRGDYEIVRISVLGDDGTGKRKLVRACAGEVFNPYVRDVSAEPQTMREKLVEFKASPPKGSQFDSTTFIPVKIKAQMFAFNNAAMRDKHVHRPYRGAQIAMMLYDTTDHDSFEHVTSWLGELKTYGSHDVMPVLVGTKCDQTHSRRVPVEKAKSFADANGMMFMEVSAKDHTKIDELLSESLQKWYQKQTQELKAEIKIEAKPHSEAEVIERVKNAKDLDERNKIVTQWKKLGHTILGDPVLSDPAWEGVRAAARQELFTEVEKIPELKARIVRLEEAAEFPIFNLQRKRGSILRAPQAVRDIRQKIKECQDGVRFERARSVSSAPRPGAKGMMRLTLLGKSRVGGAAAGPHPSPAKKGPK